MIYFINFGMPDKKSGIEHAQIKRARLFDQHHADYKFLLRDWGQWVHFETRAVGLKDDHILNMFDYYQGTTEVADQFIGVKDIDLGLDPAMLTYTDDAEKLRCGVYRPNGTILAWIGYREDDQRVAYVERYDSFANPNLIEYYDYRGFKSKVAWGAVDGTVSNNTWYDQSGRIVLRNSYQNDGTGQRQLTNWILTDLNKQIYQFDTIDQLFAHFINEVNHTTGPGNILLADQPVITDNALLELTDPAYTIAHLHSSHVVDFNQPLTSNLNEYYMYQFANASRFSAFIAATQSQADEVMARYPMIKKMYTLPVGIIADEVLAQPQIPMSKRTPGKIVALARIAGEKRHRDMIRAVAAAHKQVPEITLDLYGYVNDMKLKKSLDELIVDLEMEDVITFKPYTEDTIPVLQQAQVFLMTSTMEGFSLATLEAIAQGVVGLTYDIKYGPTEIITDGVSGVVVPNGDCNALAIKLIELFKNPIQLQQMSTAAYASAQRYSGENVWQQWAMLLENGSAVK